MNGPYISAVPEPIIPPHRSSSSLITLFLFVFPPISWYLLWKDKTRHGWFPNLLIIYAATTLLTYVPFQFLAVPQLSNLYNITETSSTNPLLTYFYIVISAAQLAYGIYLKRKPKPFINAQLAISTLMLAINFAIMTVGIYSTILSILKPITSIYSQY